MFEVTKYFSFNLFCRGKKWDVFFLSTFQFYLVETSVKRFLFIIIWEAMVEEMSLLKIDAITRRGENLNLPRKLVLFKCLLF